MLFLVFGLVFDLVDLYTKQSQNKFNYLVAGLENSYSWKNSLFLF